MKSLNKGTLLFSIDLEDVRDQVEDGHQYKERVPENTHKYLDFLRQYGVRGTFFVVGETARKYPGLIAEIVAEGHEIACHSDCHIQLDKQTSESFYREIRRNLDALYDAGATEIIGYRAPTFSVTEQTRWVYKILAEVGLKYSSSVLPAKNPLYGWPEFGYEPRTIDAILEIPISVHRFPMPRLPVVGGVYFRIIPFVLTRYSVNRYTRANRPLLTYLHPYDIDVEQEYFMHPDIDNKRHLNWLMHFNRSNTIPKLEKLVELCGFQAYDDYYRAYR
ncbi:polysaccharide deacetylase family protein [Pseudomonadota bacterium]